MNFTKLGILFFACGVSALLSAQTVQEQKIARLDITLSNLSSSDGAKKETLTTEDSQEKQRPTPWFTGPLLTSAGHVIPYGHYNIEPYEYITVDPRAYDSHWKSHSTPNFYSLSTQTIFTIGLPAKFDITFAPTWAWNHIHGASHWVLNDMPLGFDYQLHVFKKGGWFPSLKLNVSCVLPMGKYQKLKHNSKGTDVGGMGSWSPSIGLGTSHLFWFGGHIFFSPRFFIQYVFPTPVHVKGYNAYGGGHGTYGKAFPGQMLNVYFGFELSLSQNWVLAADIAYTHENKTRFKGRKGISDGVTNHVGYPSSDQFSLAPAIEYNWSNNYGIIAGVWFAFAGRNTADFTSGVIAFNYYH